MGVVMDPKKMFPPFLELNTINLFTVDEAKDIIIQMPGHAKPFCPKCQRIGVRISS